jgi:ABC-2 type transport system ATP-binding protein
MADDIALKIDHVSKDFLLPHERKNSLKEWALHFRKPSFERQHALHDINLDIKKGEFFGIVGRNGSGKSTLLKIIGGIYQPTKGKVTVNGTLTPFIELGIGFSPNLSGRENIYLNGAILGLTRKEINQKYHEIVAFAELEKFMDQKLKNYSSGMQVRLAFSIAMQAHNDILLIDEVLAVGDANFQKKCFQVFKDIKKSGKTVVFVTHDMGAVQEYCDRAMMIQDSEVVMIGKPREVALRYEVANIYDKASGQAGRAGERPKNPDIKITDVVMRSAEKTTSNFSLKDDVLADIHINVKKSQPIQLNLFFVRSDGTYVAGINTMEDLGEFKPAVGKHVITCKIKAGQLVKNTYSVSAAVYEHSDIAPALIDILDISYGSKTPLINIIEKSATQNGEFYIQGSWSKAKPGKE